MAPIVVDGARFVIAFTITVFGIAQILNPSFAPGIPQEDPLTFVTMPAWIPAHALWGYLSGAIFTACALGLMARKYARRAAMTLGFTVLVLIAIVYIPLTIAKAADIAHGLNYLSIHFALAGGAFFLASAVSVVNGSGNSKFAAENVSQKTAHAP
jgi:hypothetical protein